MIDLQQGGAGSDRNIRSNREALKTGEKESIPYSLDVLMVSLAFLAYAIINRIQRKQGLIICTPKGKLPKAPRGRAGLLCKLAKK